MKIYLLNTFNWDQDLFCNRVIVKRFKWEQQNQTHDAQISLERWANKDLKSFGGLHVSAHESAAYRKEAGIGNLLSLWNSYFFTRLSAAKEVKYMDPWEQTQITDQWKPSRGQWWLCNSQLVSATAVYTNGDGVVWF